MTLRNLQLTRTEQYEDALERAITSIVEGNLEMAANCIKAAQYVRYDLEMQALDKEDGE